MLLGSLWGDHPGCVPTLSPSVPIVQHHSPHLLPPLGKGVVNPFFSPPFSYRTSSTHSATFSFHPRFGPPPPRLTLQSGLFRTLSNVGTVLCFADRFQRYFWSQAPRKAASSAVFYFVAASIHVPPTTSPFRTPAL